MFTVVASIGLDDVDSQVFPVWYANFAEAIGNLDKDPEIKDRGAKSFQEFSSIKRNLITNMSHNTISIQEVKWSTIFMTLAGWNFQTKKF